jgi:hypothetical protein
VSFVQHVVRLSAVGIVVGLLATVPGLYLLGTVGYGAVVEPCYSGETFSVLEVDDPADRPTVDYGTLTAPQRELFLDAVEGGAVRLKSYDGTLPSAWYVRYRGAAYRLSVGQSDCGGSGLLAVIGFLAALPGAVVALVSWDFYRHASKE